MAEAREDPRVERAAVILSDASDDSLITLTVTALRAAGNAEPTLFQGYAAGAPAYLQPAIVELETIFTHWWQTLSDDEVGRRKGALLERLVQRLLSPRMRDADVHRETRIAFDSGAESEPIDVLAAPADVPWEALECKWSYVRQDNTAAHLKSLRRAADSERAQLIVGVVSLLARDTLVPNLRSQDLCADVRYVCAETLWSLTKYAPKENC